MELSDMEKKYIDNQVDGLLTQYGYDFNNDTHVDIVSFAKRFGFLVGNAQLDESEDGFLIIQPAEPQDKIIGVNSNRSFEFKRFVIAHEFAHFILHYKQGTAYLHREHKKGKTEAENDADYFAAALLMPSEAFKRMYNKLKASGLNENATCLELASVFKVPFESVSRRVNELFP